VNERMNQLCDIFCIHYKGIIWDIWLSYYFSW